MKGEKSDPVEGELIRSRMEEFKLKAKALAALANLSPRRIYQLMAGQPATASTIKAVTKPLRLTYDQITGAAPPPPASTAPSGMSFTIKKLPGDRMYIGLEIDTPADKSALHKQGATIVATIAGFVGFKDGYDPNDIDPRIGSLKITVPLTNRDCKRLVNAFLDGRLAQFKVTAVSVSMKPTSAPPASSAPPEASTPPTTEPVSDPASPKTTAHVIDVLFSKTLPSQPEPLSPDLRQELEEAYRAEQEYQDRKRRASRTEDSPQPPALPSSRRTPAKSKRPPSQTPPDISK